MNLVFFTQNKILELFYQLYLRVDSKEKVEKAGFYVAGAEFYEKFLEKHPDFEKKFFVVKEWEIYRDAMDHDADLKRLAGYEREIGDPTLWTPIVTDRRLWYGAGMNLRQDYRPRFDRRMQLSLLDVAIPRIEKMFDEVRPTAVCSIYTATFGDCIGQLFARKRGLKGLDLRMTRQKNYVMFCDGTVEPDPHITRIFNKFCKEGIPAEIRKMTEEYLDAFAKKKQIYEGNPLAGLVKEKEKQKSRKKIKLGKLVSKPFSMIAKYFKRKRPPYCYDYQDLGAFKPLLYRQYLNPWHAKKIKNRLKNDFVSLKDAEKMNFILYPMHMEPEIVLAQFARPFLNQIEVVRNICLSMPVGMTLMIKEHPRMVGRRNWGYYQKLLDIPGVKIADFSTSSEELLKLCRLVIIIRGTIGLEAGVARKPVITLGKSLYDLMDESMFRQCRNLYDLPFAIRDMLGEGYRYNYESLLSYAAAVFAGSAPANLISDLLGKGGRFKEDKSGDALPYEQHPHFDVLAEYLYKRITED